MHMGSYKIKRLPFFQVRDIGWFHTFTEFRNRLDVGWDNVWSRRCFPPCSLRSRATKIMVARLRNNFRASHLVAKFELCKKEHELTAKMSRKCSFWDGWLKDSAHQEWVLKDKLDKHYTQCVACKIQLIFFSLLVRWALQNLILVLTSPDKLLIWL